MRSICSKAKLRTVPRDRVLGRTRGPSLEAQEVSGADTHPFLLEHSQQCVHTHTHAIPNQNHIPHTTSISHNLTVTNPYTGTHSSTPHPQSFHITDMNQKTNSYSLSAVRMCIRPYTGTNTQSHLTQSCSHTSTHSNHRASHTTLTTLSLSQSHPTHGHKPVHVNTQSCIHTSLEPLRWPRPYLGTINISPLLLVRKWAWQGSVDGEWVSDWMEG